MCKAELFKIPTHSLATVTPEDLKYQVKKQGWLQNRKSLLLRPAFQKLINNKLWFFTQ
jgi:hypothetical protein